MVLICIFLVINQVPVFICYPPFVFFSPVSYLLVSPAHFFFSHWDFYFFLILWRFYYIPGKTLLSVIHVVTLFSYFSVTCILTFFEARFRDEETESEREILNDLPRAVF